MSLVLTPSESPFSLGAAAPGWMRRRAAAALRALSFAKVLIGPGVLAMLGENDGPSMLSYASSGATYGAGFFVPFVLVTFLAAYLVQEMSLRLAVVTGEGFGALIRRRFGAKWTWACTVQVAGVNLVTLVTEVIAMRIGFDAFGAPPWTAAVAGVLLVGLGASGGRYARWERLCAGLAAFNLLFVFALLVSPGHGAPMLKGMTGGLLPQGTLSTGAGRTTFLLMLASTIGATVSPWMVYFQQGASVDRKMVRGDLFTGRLNTAIGAILAAGVGCAAIVLAASLLQHHIAPPDDNPDFPRLLQPLVGALPAKLFALGLIEAGAVACMTISASTAYAVGDAARLAGGFDRRPSEAPWFHGVNIGLSVLAGAIVITPGAPLLALSLAANVLATACMPGLMVPLILLCADRSLLGRYASGHFSVGTSWFVAAAITLSSAALLLSTGADLLRRFLG